jgi:hypothetical protein
MAKQPYPFWTKAELDERRKKSEAIYRSTWGRDALQKEFRDLRATCADEVRALLEASDNLTKLASEPTFFKKKEHRAMVVPARFTTMPFISDANLKVLKSGREAAEVIVEFLDHDRFPWMANGAAAPTQAQLDAAVAATAELMAMQKSSTAKRMSGSKSQEEIAGDALKAAGLTHVPVSDVLKRAEKITSFDPALGIETHNLRDLLNPGEYSGELLVAGHRADLPVLLPSGILLPLECKVSNSPANSFKRLIRETEGKRRAWKEAFGQGALTGAVISGVFSLKNLFEDAQGRGMLIFFSHEIEALTEFVTQGGKPRQP